MPAEWHRYRLACSQAELLISGKISWAKITELPWQATAP